MARFQGCSFTCSLHVHLQTQMRRDGYCSFKRFIPHPKQNLPIEDNNPPFPTDAGAIGIRDWDKNELNRKSTEPLFQEIDKPFQNGNYNLELE